MKKSGFVLLLIIILVAVGYNIIGSLYPMDYYDTVLKYSEEYEIDPFLIMSVIKTESNFKQDATSGKSAMGLMQITDDTAKWCSEKLGVTDYKKEMLYDGEFSIRLGTFYIDYFLEKYNGDLSCALCAYNAGMGNVDNWLKDTEYSPDGKTIIKTPFKETTGYLNKVKFNLKVYEFLYGGSKDGNV